MKRSHRRHSRVLAWIALLIIGLLPIAPVVAAAQQATPVPGAYRGIPAGSGADLAAMVLTEADLEAGGFPGYARFFNGYFIPFEDVVQREADVRGKSPDDLRVAYEAFGLAQAFQVGLGLPSVPGEDSEPARTIFFRLFEFEAAAGADAFLHDVAITGPDTEWEVTAYEDALDLGDRALIETLALNLPDDGVAIHEDTTYVQVDNRVVLAGFAVVVPLGEGTPVATPATPAVADGIPDSPAATVTELEQVSEMLVANVEQVVADGTPNLPGLVLRIGDPVYDASSYSDGYRLLDGEVPSYYGGFQDDVLADPDTIAGTESVYELEEAFQFGEEESPDDHYYLVRLFLLLNEQAAVDFMASRADVLATGGFALVHEATEETSQTLLPGEATDIGDESLTFEFVRAFDDGARYAGFEVYVRVGAVVAAVSLEGPPDLPLGQVIELAEAQAACLGAEACPDAYPVPEEFYPTPAGTPEATPEN